MFSTFILFLRASLFYIGFSLATVLFAAIAIFMLLIGLPYPHRYRVMGKWTEFVLWWLKVCCGLTYQVQGLEYVPTNPAIVLSKHQSAWETIALQEILPMQTWVLKRELLWLPFFGWALATLRPIAINRSSIRHALRQVVDLGRKSLEQGMWVIIFPEGTRVAPGENKQYRGGGALLAARTGYLVVPIAHNSGEFWPPRSFIKYPGTIQVRIGPAIETTGKTAQEITELAEKWIENSLSELPRRLDSI